MGQGHGNHSGQLQHQGQWVDNQPRGWSTQGKKKGWAKKGAITPVGLDKNYMNNGKYPKGLQKTR